MDTLLLLLLSVTYVTFMTKHKMNEYNEMNIFYRKQKAKWKNKTKQDEMKKMYS